MRTPASQLRSSLDGRRFREADVEWRIYVGPEGRDTGIHIVKASDGGQEYRVAGPSQTIRPGSFVPTGSHTGMQGEVILLQEPEPGRRGAEAPRVGQTVGPPAVPALTGHRFFTWHWGKTAPVFGDPSPVADHGRIWCAEWDFDGTFISLIGDYDAPTTYNLLLDLANNELRFVLRGTPIYGSDDVPDGSLAMRTEISTFGPTYQTVWSPAGEFFLYEYRTAFSSDTAAFPALWHPGSKRLYWIEIDRTGTKDVRLMRARADLTEITEIGSLGNTATEMFGENSLMWLADDVINHWNTPTGIILANVVTGAITEINPTTHLKSPEINNLFGLGNPGRPGQDESPFEVNTQADPVFHLGGRSLAGSDLAPVKLWPMTGPEWDFEPATTTRYRTVADGLMCVTEQTDTASIDMRTRISPINQTVGIPQHDFRIGDVVGQPGTIDPFFGALLPIS